MKAYLPLRWRRALRRILYSPLYSGNYANWNDALCDSTGYAVEEIVRKAVIATRSVRDGYACWERDTVQFSSPSINEPLLECLRVVAEINHGRLNLVDFGGALGSTWWQHRASLEGLTEVRWSVIEQPAFVAAGRREFTVGPLRFFTSLGDCLLKERPTVILLSSVLPYLERPHEVLDQVRRESFRHIIVDRTGFVIRGDDRLTVQHVPPTIYRASYPCWFFSRERLFKAFAGSWRLVREWVTADDVDINAEHRGFMLERFR